MALVTGYGRGTWSEGPYSQPIPVAVTGSSATSSAGTAVGGVIVLVTSTGEVITMQVGDILVAARGGNWVKVTPDQDGVWVTVVPTA